MPLVSFSPAQVASSSNVNANFALCVLTDTSRTVTVTHTYTSSQTFTGGWSAGAACSVSAGGLSVASGTTAVQALTATTGVFSSTISTAHATASSLIFNTTTGATSDTAQILFQRAAAGKWRIGTNIEGTNNDEFDIHNDSLNGPALKFANTTGAATFSAGVTVPGTVTLTAAASKIVPGATSFAHRNNADSADNVLISDAGVVTVRAGLTLTSGPLTFSQASQKIALPSGSGIDFRLASDAGSVLLVNDTGTVQLSNGTLTLAAATTARASLNMPSGTAPTSPTDGMIWYDGTNVKIRVGGSTKTFTIT